MNRILGFLIGKSVYPKEYDRLAQELPIWLAFYGHDLAAELNMEYEALMRRAAPPSRRGERGGQTGW
jgi:hypothetical protein